MVQRVESATHTYMSEFIVGNEQDQIDFNISDERVVELVHAKWASSSFIVVNVLVRKRLSEEECAAHAVNRGNNNNDNNKPLLPIFHLDITIAMKDPVTEFVRKSRHRYHSVGIRLYNFFSNGPAWSDHYSRKSMPGKENNCTAIFEYITL
jgi:hypothetical protein